MVNINNCSSCEELLTELNYKLTNIGDNRLYNIRYELNREVDYELFTLLIFYKKILTDICKDEDCGCYTTPKHYSHSNVILTSDPIDNTLSVVNHCVCGCCEPLNPVCINTKVQCPDDSHKSSVLTTENIFERIKILIS